MNQPTNNLANSGEKKNTVLTVKQLIDELNKVVFKEKTIVKVRLPKSLIKKGHCQDVEATIAYDDLGCFTIDCYPANY